MAAAATLAVAAAWITVRPGPVAGRMKGGPPAPDVVVLAHATLVQPGRPAMPDSAVVLAGQRIAAMGPVGSVEIPHRASVLDLSGMYLAPGLADMHHHVARGIPLAPDDPEADLRRLLGLGVTMVFHPGGALENFERLAHAGRDAEPVSRYFGAGLILTAPGGHEWRAGGAIANPAEGRRAVQELAALGVSAIKIAYDDASWIQRAPLPMLSHETAQAVIDEARRHGLRVFAHAPILHFAKEALKLGVDGLIHGILSDPVDDEFLQLMRRREAFYVPTESLYELLADPAGWVHRLRALDYWQITPAYGYWLLDSPAYQAALRWNAPRQDYVRQQLPVARANLRRVHEAGIPVVMGTDSGPPGLPLGITSQAELILYVEAGLSAEEALRTATEKAARMLGLERELGSLQPGQRADLVAFYADPRADIRNVRWIFRVVKAGVVYHPGELLGR